MFILRINEIILTVLMVLFAGTVVFAQANFNGEATLSFLNLDDEGNRSAARELYDTYDGINLERLYAYGKINPHTRYYLKLENLNLDGRGINVGVTDINLFKFKANFRQNRLLFGADEDLKNERKSYSSYLEIRPVEEFTGFVEYRGFSNEGNRILYDITEQGLFGNLYDRKSTWINGGVKLRHQGNQLKISYGNRKYDDAINDSLDSKTNILDLSIYGRVHPKIKLVFDFKNAVKTKELSDDKLTDNVFGLIVLSNPVPELTLAPVFNYRTVTGEPTDPEFSAWRFGLTADYSLQTGTTLSGKIGYESRNSADMKSNLFYYSIGTRYRINEKISAKANYSGQTRKDPDENLLTGVEEKTRIKAEINFILNKNTDIKTGYKSISRENGDINTQAESGTFYVGVNSDYKNKVSTGLYWNHSDMKYSWNEEHLNYKYDSFTGSIKFYPTPKLTMSTGGVFYLYEDDVRQAKLDMTLGISYKLPKAAIGISYRRYELDGYSIQPSYYEANMIKGELTINFK